MRNHDWDQWVLTFPNWRNMESRLLERFRASFIAPPGADFPYLLENQGMSELGWRKLGGSIQNVILNLQWSLKIIWFNPVFL